VGGFFRDCSDELIASMRGAGGNGRRRVGVGAAAVGSSAGAGLAGRPNT
jgi:hypothetical protein